MSSLPQSPVDSFAIDRHLHYSQPLIPVGRLRRSIAVGFRLESG